MSAAYVAELLPPAERPAILPPAVPTTPDEIAAAVTLARFCTTTAVERHAGELLQLYTPRGRQTVARGRDLTACRLLIGTGGALVRLPGGEELLGEVRAPEGGSERLLPPSDAQLRARPRLRAGVLRRAVDALLGRGRRGADAEEHRRLARLTAPCAST